MAKEYYMRTLTAGRYVKVVRYSRSLPSDSKVTRQHKQTATNAAQKFINIRNGTEKLQLLLCANFDSKEACFCTFTFQAEQLPANQRHTQRIFTGYLSKLRKEWRRTSRELPYIYTVEGVPHASGAAPLADASSRWETIPWTEKGRWAQMDAPEPQETPEPATRLHVHCFFLLKKEDYLTIRALWPYGHVHINPMKVNEPTTFQRLASYVTKEKRTDQKGNGVRAYVPSLGLIQPEPGGRWCSEFEGITLPKGAEEIKSGSENDEIYGTSMEYLLYRLPRPVQTPQPYKSKGKLHPASRPKRTQ